MGTRTDKRLWPECPLTCELEACGKSFQRPGRRGPRPRFCSIKCRGKWAYRQPHIKAYQQAYAARPDRRHIRMLAGRERYSSEEYRVWARDRWRRLNFFGVEIAAPYTGHRWLEMARDAVSAGHLDSSAPWADDYHDEMGEAVLALLEGRDMAEAVKAYRKQEFVPRRMTMHMGDWGDDPDQQNRWWDSMPVVPSAEDEVVLGEAIAFEIKARYHRGSNNKTNFSKKGPKRLSQPSRRRMKGAGWEKHAA